MCYEKYFKFNKERFISKKEEIKINFTEDAKFVFYGDEILGKAICIFGETKDEVMSETYRYIESEFPEIIEQYKKGQYSGIDSITSTVLIRKAVENVIDIYIEEV